MQALTSSRFRTMFQKLYCLNEIQCRPRMSKLDEKLLGDLPTKPKRPPNSFILFIKDMETKIYTDNPGYTRPEMVRMAGKMWRTADEDVKSRYQKIFQDKNKAYEEALVKFNMNLTKRQRESISKLELDKATKKKKKNINKTLSELGKPKRPPGSYGLYLREQMSKPSDEEQTSKPSDAVHKDRMRRLADEWKTLSDADKQVYVDKSREMLNIYYQELKEWETNVLKTLDMSEEDVEELRQKSAVDGAPRSKPKRLSNYIYSWVSKK